MSNPEYLDKTGLDELVSQTKGYVGNKVSKKIDKPVNVLPGKVLQTDSHGDPIWGEAVPQADIVQAVDDWLEENIDPGSAITLDPTLTQAQAAAQAKAVGDKIDSLKENLIVVDDDEPESDDNVVWVPETPESEKVVPEMSELNEVAGTVAKDYADLTFPVKAGTLCRHNYGLYAAKQDIPTQETWTSGHWSTKTNIADKLDSLSNAINGKYTKPQTGIPASDLASGVIPTVHNVPSGGSTGEVLKKVSGTDYDLEWGTVAAPSDAQVVEAVSDWLDDHPEATTTVEDGSITKAKLSSSLSEELDGKAPAILADTEKAYWHDCDGDIKSATLYVDEDVDVDITAKYTLSKNLLEDKLATGSYGGITRTKHGRYILLSGTRTGGSGYKPLEITDGNILADFAGKTVNIYMYFKVVWNHFSNFWTLRYKVGNSWTNIGKVWSAPNGWIAYTSVSIPADIVAFEFAFDDIKGQEFHDGDFYWFGMYTTEVVDTGETITEDYTIYPSGTQQVDTVLHESSAEYVADTKTYIDNHTPDIKAYWTEEIYALPEKFGAVGDGVADDASAISDCMTYAVANNKAVRGFGTYKISTPIDILSRGMDVYFKNINYTGNQYAIGIKERDICFEFDTIQSSGKGLKFEHQTNTGCSINRVRGTKIVSAGDCISIGRSTLYNSCDIRQLSSSGGNCITYEYGEEGFYGGEFVFRDCSCACPSGWVLYEPHDSKFYNFTVEGNCLNGIYHPWGCVCYGWRHTEFIDRYAYRISGDHTEYQNGALIKFSGDIGTSQNWNGIVYESENFIYPFSIDTDDIPKNPTFSTTDLWWHYSNNRSVIKCCVLAIYAVFGYSSASIIAKEMRIVGANKVFIPLFPSKQNVSTQTYDLRFYDTCDITTIQNATKILMATEFDAQTDTTIYLNGSYCATGINEISIDTNGNDVAVYDNRENKIFDSTDYTGEKFRLKCVANHGSRGIGPSDSYQRYWTYDGTNHVWEIEER